MMGRENESDERGVGRAERVDLVHEWRVGAEGPIGLGGPRVAAALVKDRGRKMPAPHGSG